MALMVASSVIGEIDAGSGSDAIRKIQETEYDLPFLCHNCASELNLNDDPFRFEAERIK